MAGSLRDQFSRLSPRQRALICMAVLFDGVDAGSFLESDARSGIELRAAADVLSSQQADLRLPLVATLLRQAVEELS